MYIHEYASECMCAFKYARMGVKRMTYKIKNVSTFYNDSSIKLIWNDKNILLFIYGFKCDYETTYFIIANLMFLQRYCKLFKPYFHIAKNKIKKTTIVKYWKYWKTESWRFEIIIFNTFFEYASKHCVVFPSTLWFGSLPDILSENFTDTTLGQFNENFAKLYSISRVMESVAGALWP